MWKIYNYESGLKMINSEEEYRKWRITGRAGLIKDAVRDIEHRDETGEPITFPLKLGLSSDTQP